MTAYIVRRLFQGLIILILVTMFVFLVMHLLPGDPLEIYMGSDAASFTPERHAALAHEYGLDKSLPEQYVNWIKGVLHGDLGTSILLREKVGPLIAQRLPITIHLGVLALLVSNISGITFGVVCALRRGKWIDTVFPGRCLSLSSYRPYPLFCTWSGHNAGGLRL